MTDHSISPRSGGLPHEPLGAQLKGRPIQRHIIPDPVTLKYLGTTGLSALFGTAVNAATPDDVYLLNHSTTGPDWTAFPIGATFEGRVTRAQYVTEIIRRLP